MEKSCFCSSSVVHTFTKTKKKNFTGLKLPESTLNRDLSALLREQPPSALKGAVTATGVTTGSTDASDPAALPLLLSLLPPALLTDLRYLSPHPAKRDALVAVYISTLGDPSPSPHEPPRQQGDDAAEGGGGGGEGKGDRRQQEALAARAAAIAAQKQRAEQARRAGLRALRDEEAEVARALRVGKDGLRMQLAQTTTTTTDGGGGGGGGGRGGEAGGGSGGGDKGGDSAPAAAAGSAAT